MNLVITLEHRFDGAPDGTVWTQTAFPYSFWQRYLEIFDTVRIVARVRPISSVPTGWNQADGEKVSFIAIPYYVGPFQYLLKSFQIQKLIESTISLDDAIILRVYSNVANCIEPWIRRTGHPYGLEVAGDPYDAFSPGAIRHPLRPFFRWWFTRRLKHQCIRATAISYVTKYALQNRYPASTQAFSTYNSDVFLTYYSSVELSNKSFATTPWQNQKELHSITLITIASLEHLYKAPEVLIDAVALCIQEGMNLKLVLVGDGKHRRELEERAEALGIKEQVIFRGQLTAGKAICDELDQADLFVLPSRQEGLPRAMVEAMSRGLPCIGSTIGGIPELLPAEDLVLPNDVNALVAKIREVVRDPKRMKLMSIRNLEIAKEYRDEVLRERRIEFYRYLKDVTASWLRS